MIHSLSDVQTHNIGKGTTIWQYSIVLPNAIIGNNCNINCHVFIENNVVIGNNVTIKSGVQVWNGIEIEDDVFVGPNVTFTNDITPRSKVYPETFSKILVQRGSSIGANSSILAGVTIGKYAMIGMGSNVIKDVPPYALVYGNPAKQMGWVDENGDKLVEVSVGVYQSIQGILFELNSLGLLQKRV